MNPDERPGLIKAWRMAQERAEAFASAGEWRGCTVMTAFQSEIEDMIGSPVELMEAEMERRKRLEGRING